MFKFRRPLAIFLVTLMVLVTMHGNASVKAEVLTPKISFVGVEHSPLVEGDNEAFYLVSRNYSGDVQYRVLLYIQAKDAWEDITNGYTQPVNPKELYKIVPDKVFTQGKYKLSVRVKRAGMTGINSDANGDFDNSYTAYLNCVNKDDLNRVYANGNLQVERTTYAAGENVVINGIEGISGMKAPYSYKLHIYNADKDSWVKDVTGYSSSITWKADETGTYMMDVWAKSSDSKAKYESWKLKEINVIDAQVYREDGKIYTTDSDKSIIITGSNVSYKNAKINGNLYIYGDNAILENVNVTGNIIIDPGKDGNANLNTVSAAKIDVRSGGQDSIHLYGVKAKILTVDNQNGTSPVRVESSGETEIDTTVVGTYAIIDSKSGSFGTIEVKKSVSGELIVEFRGTFKKTIKVTDGATIKSNGADIENIELAPDKEGANITLDGSFINVSASKPANINTTSRTNIKNFLIPQGSAGSKMTLTGQGTVGNIQNMSSTLGLSIGRNIIVTGVIEAVNKTIVNAENPDTAGKVDEKPVSEMTNVIDQIPHGGNTVVVVKTITVAGTGNATTVTSGQALQMTATVTPSNATNKNVTWSVANGTGSASINASGLLTGTGVGTVEVKATATDGSGVVGTKQITVTALPDSTPPASPTYSPANNAADVAIDITPSLTFSEALFSDGSGASMGASPTGVIKVYEGSDNSGTELTEGAGSDNAHFTVTYDSGSRRFTVIFGAAMKNGQAYYVELQANKIYDAAGNPINSAEGIKFTTIPGNSAGLIVPFFILSAGDETVSPVKAQNTLNYTAVVPFLTESITVIPVAAEGTITVNDIPIVNSCPSPSILLSYGANVITIKVTEVNKLPKVYQITVNRPMPLPMVWNVALSAAGVATWAPIPIPLAGYSVQLFKDNSLYGPAVNTASNVFEHDFLSAMRLAGEGSYTVAVTAIGDGVQYVNSAPSPVLLPQIVVWATPVSDLAFDSNGRATWSNTNGTSYDLQLYKEGMPQGAVVNAANGTTGYSFLAAMRAAGEGNYTISVTTKSNAGLIIDSNIPVMSSIQVVSKLAAVTEELNWAGNVAHWTGVTNAVSYDVQLYKGINKCGAVKNVLAADAAAGADFGSQITAAGAGEYTYTVTAKASGSDLLLDAGPSIPSAINDRQAPVFSGTYPKAGVVQERGSRQAEILVEVDEAGTAYYVAVADGAGAPGASQVMAGKDSNNNAALAAGNVQVSANTEKSIITEALPADAAAYDVYVVVVDGSSNATTAVKVDITTPEIAPGAAITGLDVPAHVLQIGETTTATAATTQAGASAWTSSNSSAATVDAITGVVTAKGAGTTTIAYTTSTSGSVSSIDITVYAAASIADPLIGEVRVGAGAVTPTGFTLPGDGQTIAWSSSDTGKAVIDSSTGAINAVAAGSTTISYKTIETSTGRIVAKGQLSITVQSAKTVTIGSLAGGIIMAKTAAAGRTYTVTTANIADGKVATITWEGNTQPDGISIEAAGTVLNNTLTLNVTVDENAPTVAGNYYFTVTVDGIESAAKKLTIGNSATFSGVTMDVRIENAFPWLIIKGLSKIDSGSTFDINKFIYVNEIGGTYQLTEAYTKSDNPIVSSSGPGIYLYDSDQQTLVIVLTNTEFSGISSVYTGDFDTLSADTGWNVSNGVNAVGKTNVIVTVQQ